MTDNESNNSAGFTASETRFLVSVMKNFEGGKITVSIASGIPKVTELIVSVQ